MADENGVWRTISGRRVFIKEGQSLSDAMRESGKFAAEKTPEYKPDEEYGKIPESPDKALVKIAKDINAEIGGEEWEVLQYGTGSMKRQNIAKEGIEETLSGGRRQFTDIKITVTSPRKVMGYIDISQYEKIGMGGGLSDFSKSSQRIEFENRQELIAKIKKIG